MNTNSQKKRKKLYTQLGETLTSDARRKRPRKNKTQRGEASLNPPPSSSRKQPPYSPDIKKNCKNESFRKKSVCVCVSSQVQSEAWIDNSPPWRSRWWLWFPRRVRSQVEEASDLTNLKCPDTYRSMSPELVFLHRISLFFVGAIRSSSSEIFLFL